MKSPTTKPNFLFSTYRNFVQNEMCPIRFNNGEYGISTSQDPLLSSTSNFSFTPVNRSVASDETGSTFDSAQFDFETLPTSSGFTSPQIDSPNPSYNQYATSILDLTKLTSPATESFHPSNARSNSPIPTTPNPHTADYESISRGALFSPRHISRFISYGTDTTPQTPESFQSSVDSRQGRTAIDHPGLIPKIHHSGSSSFNSIKGQDQTLTENLVAKGGVFPVLVTGPPIASLENSNYLNSLSTSKEQEQDSRLANLGRTYLRTSQSPPCNTFYTRSQLHQLAFQPAPLHPTMNTLSTPMQAYQTPQQSSPPPLPATSFPTPLPPPANLPVRVPPLLDEAFASQNLILDPSTDENRNTKAWDALMQHKKDRFPHVMNASDRLQAAMGLKNEHPFDLPQTPASVLANRAALPPALRALYDVPDVGLGINLNSEPVRGVKRNLNATEPKTSMGLGDTVDKETGRGLREFLLLRGKEVGMRKVACKSLTFHDFTPDLRTNAHRNVILGHYAAEAGCRADFYEVELCVLFHSSFIVLIDGLMRWQASDTYRSRYRPRDPNLRVLDLVPTLATHVLPQTHIPNRHTRLRQHTILHPLFIHLHLTSQPSPSNPNILARLRPPQSPRHHLRNPHGRPLLQ